MIQILDDPMLDVDVDTVNYIYFYLTKYEYFNDSDYYYYYYCHFVLNPKCTISSNCICFEFIN